MHEDTPTTMNGPLHTDERDRSHRQITAIFDSEHAAMQARDKLAAAGIAGDRITVEKAADNATIVASSHAPDQNILGKIRDALLPDEGTKVQHDAIALGHHVLSIKTDPSDTEKAVGILQDCNPASFDARLERWRNI
jgi:hypothetical protein